MDDEERLFTLLRRPSVAEIDHKFMTTSEEEMPYIERLKYLRDCGWDFNEYIKELDKLEDARHDRG